MPLCVCLMLLIIRATSSCFGFALPGMTSSFHAGPAAWLLSMERTAEAIGLSDSVMDIRSLIWRYVPPLIGFPVRDTPYHRGRRTMRNISGCSLNDDQVNRTPQVCFFLRLGNLISATG